MSSESSSDIATLDGDGASASQRPGGEVVPRGASIGRYLVVDVAGHGAMGVVYRAYDPELEREVAVKLLRRHLGAHDERSAGQLRREAQAMAKVSHPNVLPVYDAGTHGGRVWIAMEYLRAQTLTAWCSAQTRTRAEIVAMYVQAARGLAAAHEAGVVHRDFKADNVLVGADGRVRVLDFGLARAASRREVSQSGIQQVVVVGDDVAAIDGDTDDVVGTPRYMAPEQHFGRHTDGRADQFAFCVALFEAIYGRPPFTGTSIGELALRKHEGRIDPATDAAAVPGWLRAVVVRGLDPDPSARYPTMHALVEALLDDPISHRRKIWRIAGGSALVVGVAVALSWGVVRQRPCRDAARKLDGIWNTARGERVREVFAQTAVSFAEDTSARVIATLDAYATTWSTAHDAACAATKIHGEQSEELLDVRIACLDRQRVELAALLDVFEVADAAVVERAVPAVRSLAKPAVCDATATLLAVERPPDDLASAEAIARVEAQLAVAAASAAAGRDAEASVVAEAALVEARAVGFAPLVARAALEAGGARPENDLTTARERFYEALEHGFAGGENHVAQRALVELAHLDAWIPGRLDLARGWIRLGRGWTAVTDDPAIEHALLNAEALALRTAGDLEGAIDAMRRAVDSARQHGADGLRIGRLLGNVGAIYGANDEPARALEFLRQAEAAVGLELGPDHPQTLALTANIGIVIARSGDPAEAIAILERTAELQEGALGADAPELLNTLNALATSYRRQGDPQRAVDLHRRVLAARERSFGPESEQVAESAGNLATCLRGIGRLDEAHGMQARSLAILSRLHPPEHAQVGMARVGWSQQLSEEGRTEEALAEAAHSVRILGAALGLLHPQTLVAKLGHARLLATTGQTALARQQVELIVSATRTAGADVTAAARARFELARLMDDDARAVALANEGLELAGTSDAGLRDEIERWLRDRSR